MVRINLINIYRNVNIDIDEDYVLTKTHVDIRKTVHFNAVPFIKTTSHVRAVVSMTKLE